LHHESDIEGIVYGGTSSRFWLFRKHINCIESVSELQKVPFYAWDCITLILNHREVDLVIRNEAEMKILLTFLIYRMKTLDGNKNSAVPILEALNKQTVREYLNETGRKIVTESKEH